MEKLLLDVKVVIIESKDCVISEKYFEKWFVFKRSFGLIILSY